MACHVKVTLREREGESVHLGRHRQKHSHFNVFDCILFWCVHLSNSLNDKEAVMSEIFQTLKDDVLLHQAKLLPMLMTSSYFQGHVSAGKG